MANADRDARIGCVTHAMFSIALTHRVVKGEIISVTHAMFSIALTLQSNSLHGIVITSVTHAMFSIALTQGII